MWGVFLVGARETKVCACPTLDSLHATCDLSLMSASARIVLSRVHQLVILVKQNVN
ncbi:hypothetical protein [Ligilactobacillus acidipiscis]|uniref:hypothetical protein n=1 Tax=Ligilactobacillus acidipiscis TaxID=89059 RepID=UPI0022E5A1FF|nr:hypothetical protein [Ligilactobacillus acidipiscis]